MISINMDIWGRKMTLEVIYDIYEDETVSDIQKEALAAFRANPRMIDGVLDQVKKYCTDHESFSGEGGIDNIFRYVMPRTIYVGKSEKDRKVGLLCDYRLDMEHGLAIVFKNGKLSEIGEEGIIL